MTHYKVVRERSRLVGGGLVSAVTGAMRARVYEVGEVTKPHYTSLPEFGLFVFATNRAATEFADEWSAGQGTTLVVYRCDIGPTMLIQGVPGRLPPGAVMTEWVKLTGEPIARFVGHLGPPY